MIKKLLLLTLISVSPLLSMGCGPGAGSQGDSNDPAQTTDEDQMADETGDVGT